MIDQDYFHDYMQDIYASSEAQSDYQEVVFTERLCDFMVDEAVIENYTPCAYRKSTTGLKVDAYDYNTETGNLVLIVTDYRSKAETLTSTDITAAFKRATKFFRKSLDREFHVELEESSLGFELARLINEHAQSITKVRFFLISNAFLSKRVDSLADLGVDSYDCSFDVWDLGRIERIESSGKSREDIIVDFTDNHGEGLPCLPAYTGSESYESYMIVMPGGLIANLYDKYGERLLEQNVRTFLQFRGKVNKGIRNTIQNQPDMFFAYNNGITATAEEVTTTNDKNLVRINTIRNLQIVNGGQTTASLYTSMKKSRADLSDIYVQVKLSVIPSERTEEVVPRISEYANTQNKVSAADFFSNRPFHLRIEEMSRRLWAPSPEGSVKDTHWYYERVRGQYANAQATMTPAQKKEFLIHNPRRQMFTKTDLAKFEYTWEQLPHKVSLGAQKNFVMFAEKVAKDWEGKEKHYNEMYFKQLIAKAIIFRTLDRTLMKQPWYGGYKANIVTYTIAKFSELVSATGKHLNFEKIWKDQVLQESVQNCLLDIARLVNEAIQDTPEGVTNVTEWCKKDHCWANVKKIDYRLPDEISAFMIEASAHKEKQKDAISTRKIDNGIEAQAYVVEKGSAYWNSMIDWNTTENQFTEKELSILVIASRIPAKLPSEKQSLALLDIERKAIEEGMPES